MINRDVTERGVTEVRKSDGGLVEVGRFVAEWYPNR